MNRDRFPLVSVLTIHKQAFLQPQGALGVITVTSSSFLKQFALERIFEQNGDVLSESCLYFISILVKHPDEGHISG